MVFVLLLSLLTLIKQEAIISQQSPERTFDINGLDLMPGVLLFYFMNKARDSIKTESVTGIVDTPVS